MKNRIEAFSLRKRVFAGLALALSLMLLTWLSLLRTTFTSVPKEAEQYLMLDAAFKIAGQLQPEVFSGISKERLDNKLEVFLAANPRISFYLLDKTGQVLFFKTKRKLRERMSQHVPIAPIDHLLEQGHATTLPLTNLDPIDSSTPTIFSAAPIEIAGEDAFLYLTLKSDEPDDLHLQVAIRNSLKPASILYACITLSLALIGFAFVYYLQQRLDRLQRSVVRFGLNDFSRIIDDPSNDEIGLLAKSIDQMALSIRQTRASISERDTLRRDLIADISHDLRGPVASIKGFLELLQSPSFHSQQSKLNASVASIQRSLGLLEQLVASLKELSCIEAKRQSLEISVFQLNTFAESIFRSVEVLGIEKQITSSFTPPDTPLIVSGDALLLERAIRNLIENAIYYTEPGKRVCVGVRREGTMARFYVTDEGYGISENEMKSILDRFGQGSNAGKSSRKSSGLGLAIVQSIILLHGSRIQIASEVGRGSMFSFVLPIISAESNVNSEYLERKNEK